MKQLKITLVMPEAPLPFGGAAARWYHTLLTELLMRGNEVKVFASCITDDCNAKVIQTFGQERFHFYGYYFNERPGLYGKLQTCYDPSSFLWTSRMRRALLSASRESDIVHLEGMSSAWLAPNLGANSVLNVHHLISVDLSLDQRSFWQRWMCFREVRAIKAQKYVSTITAQLQENVRKTTGIAALHIPFAFDALLYDYQLGSRPKEAPIVGLIGNFSWRPTTLAADRLLDDLWPGIVERFPDARLMLVGRAAKDMFGTHARNICPSCIVEQDVEVIRPFFSMLDVLVYAPAVGSGIKVKILEAMAYGTPVVTNDSGVEGIPAVNGVHCAIGNTNEELMTGIFAMLSCESFRTGCVASARRLVEKELRGKPVVDRWEELYMAMLERRAFASSSVRLGADALIGG